jgi:hypothetical protein
VLRHRVARTAFDNYKSLADHHIEPTLSRKRVSKLTPADVDALVSAKLDSGLSSSTVGRIRSVLSQALDQAVRWGVVTRDVVTMTKGRVPADALIEYVRELQRASDVVPLTPLLPPS